MSARCRSRWPEVRAEKPDAAIAAFGLADGLHLENLWLATACGDGDPAALAAFEKEILPAALAGAARIDASPDFRDELAQTVRQLLFAPRSGAPRIADYRGRGSLVGWTRAVALRCGLRLRKNRGGLPGDVALEQVASAASPELLCIQAEFRGEFQQAFAAALRGLDRRDRTLLRLHLVERMTLEWLASANGVHRTTIVRWLASARAEVLKSTRAQLTTLLKLERAEVDNMINAVGSRLDLSLSQLLRTTGGD